MQSSGLVSLAELLPPGSGLAQAPNCFPNNGQQLPKECMLLCTRREASGRAGGRRRKWVKVNTQLTPLREGMKVWQDSISPIVRTTRLSKKGSQVELTQLMTRCKIHDKATEAG